MLKRKFMYSFALLTPVPLLALMPSAVATVAANQAVVSTSAAISGYQLNIDTRNPAAKISPTLFGAFFEDINHAADGGLYGELLSNRAFSNSPMFPANWFLVNGPRSTGSVSLDVKDVLNKNRTASLVLSITHVAKAEQVGVENNGYSGIAVRKGLAYRGFFFAKASPGFKGGVTVSLQGTNGKILATAHVPSLTTAWAQYPFTLTATASSNDASFVMSANHTGSITFGFASLFPPTWKSQPNGLRLDLAQMVQQMDPKFMRFPGGNFVEGNALADAYNWKETIGPIWQRPGHYDLWGYPSTDGLGFLEYLEWCQELGAQPLYVVSVGIALNPSGPGGYQTVPLNQIHPWIQNALDAIQFANGPVTSKWGALRAKYGHPQPFHLKYVELGNENGFQQSAYAQRYPLFYKAIKKAYPNLTLIANSLIPGQPIDMVDLHYYNSPQWFLDNANLFNTYSRKDPKVFVGEYAAQTDGIGQSQGTLSAALGEAAFMTGLERNSDVVRMASYAPLFQDINNYQWSPDAIVFNNHAAYGTPSYYVQQMFARNTGTVVLPATLKPLGANQTAATSITGEIGLGSWNTQVEYKDLKVTSNVTGQTLLSNSFANTNSPGWKVLNGHWTMGSGVYRQTSPETDATATTGNPDWNNYTMTVDAKKLSGAEGFLVMFGVKNAHNYYWWNLGGWGNTQYGTEKTVNDNRSLLGQQIPVQYVGQIQTNQWYKIKIDVTGEKILCYLNGKLIETVADQPPAGPLYDVASRDAQTGDIIVTVVNSSSVPQTTQIALAGQPRVQSRGTVTTLTSGSLDNESSFSQPLNIVPVTRPLTNVSDKFSYSFPKYSVTVIRIKTTSAQ